MGFVFYSDLCFAGLLFLSDNFHSLIHVWLLDVYIGHCYWPLGLLRILKKDAIKEHLRLFMAQ